MQSQAALLEAHKQLAAVRARLLTVEEGELKRIAREIHDDLNQQLSMISVQVDQLASHLPADREEICQRLREMETQLARLSDDLHRMAHQLHPSTLEDLGLIPALRSHCRDLSRHEKISISFEHQGKWKRLPSEVTLSIYRVTQEALTNVVKHSNAKKVDVSLSSSQTGVRLRVRDFGKGFKKQTKKRGLGLLSMQERVRLVGGTFSVSSEPGDGTIIEAEFPV